MPRVSKAKTVTINENPVFIVYTLPTCPYSIDVLETLKELQIPHKNIVVTANDAARL